MNARQAVLENEKLVNELIENSKEMAVRMNRSVEDCINHKVNAYIKRSSSVNAEIAWDLRREEALKIVRSENKVNETYNVVFNDDSNSNDKGFELTLEEAISYINQYNGTDESYFADYKKGTVQVVSNTTGEVAYEEDVK